MKKHGFYIAALLIVALISFKSEENRVLGKYYPPVSDTTKPQQFSVTLPIQSWIWIDSVMRNAHYSIGRKLDFEKADSLKQSVEAIIGEFTRQINQQLADTSKQKPKK